MTWISWMLKLLLNIKLFLFLCFVMLLWNEFQDLEMVGWFHYKTSTAIYEIGNSALVFGSLEPLIWWKTSTCWNGLPRIALLWKRYTPLTMRMSTAAGVITESKGQKYYVCKDYKTRYITNKQLLFRRYFKHWKSPSIYFYQLLKRAHEIIMIKKHRTFCFLK